MKYLIQLILVSGVLNGLAQPAVFSREDSLLGSNTAYRNWWDVRYYDISVMPDLKAKTISGVVSISYQVLTSAAMPEMQIDLQEPLVIDSVRYDGLLLNNIRHENNRWMLALQAQEKGVEHRLKVWYHGKPKIARNPPWDGGFVWQKDSLGNPWVSVACQGAGASVWFPCKELQADEPDRGARLAITVPDTLNAIGNGRLVDVVAQAGRTITYTWEVLNPINAYDIIPYIGKYKLVRDSVQGEKGILRTDYWVLGYHENKVASHLKPNVVKTMACFEHWFGPYPFYEDSYKLVEAPYLGMEHQSSVAYGNHFLNGYLGRDLSQTGWGLKWDFIVVHESGHEWFGNSITAADVADNWIHEGFTSYSEVLFTECEFGKEAGNDYCEGVRKTIANDVPLIGPYGVRREGSADIYNKGSNLLHTIRQLVDNDEQFRLLLRDINAQFYHKVVTTAELEAFIIAKTGLDLRPVFDQYLRTTKIPVLQYKLNKGKLSFRYANCVSGFNMPVKITVGKERLIHPTTDWQSIQVNPKVKRIALDRNVYVDLLK